MGRRKNTSNQLVKLMQKLEQVLSEIEEYKDTNPQELESDNLIANVTDLTDLDDIDVYPADGVLIKQEKDEIRLLFFYIKPTLCTSETNTIRPKGVVEFRIPNSVFLEMVEEFNDTANQIHLLIKPQDLLDNHMYM